MEEANSIERYRKRRRQRQNRRRLFALTVLLVLGTALYLSSDWWLELFRNADLFGRGSEPPGFPVALASSAEYDMQGLESSIAVLTDTYLYTYGADGAQASAFQHNYSNPVMKVSGRRVLLYDKNGNDFVVRSKSGAAYEKTFDEKIILARISGDEYVAVVTESARYFAEMKVFDSRGQEIFSWYSENKILDVEFTEGSRGCVVSSLSASGGRLVTVLTCFSFTSEQQLWSTQVPGLMLFTLKLSTSGALYAIGDTGAAAVSADGTLAGTYTYTGELSGYSVSPYAALAVFYDSENRRLVLASVDERGEAKETEIDGAVQDVYADQGDACVLLSDQLLIYDEKLAQVASYELDQVYEQVIAIGNYYYLLGGKAIERIRK